MGELLKMLRRAVLLFLVAGVGYRSAAACTGFCDGKKVSTNDSVALGRTVDHGARYVAADGDDAADGLTPVTAWRSLAKLSADLPAGGTAYLRCDDTFFGEIKVKGGPDAAHPTVVTSYGTGAKPVLTYSKVLRDDPAVWQTGVGTVPLYGLWWCDLTNPTNYVGVDTADINPGTLLVDGEIKPWRKFCRHDVNRQWDFAAEGKYLFVYSTNNPALVSREIRVSLKEGVVDLVSNFVISNVTCRMIGGCAMCGGWNECDVLRHVRVTDCDFEHIGGSMLSGFEQGEFARKVRFGNGIEFGHNVQDAVVERCRFDGVYDTAFTMQGFPTVSWKDVHVRDCHFTNCAQAYELWCRNAPPGVGFERCSFTNNVCFNVGGGWGAETRPNRSVATPLLMYFMETDTMDVEISGNVFECCPNGLIFKLGGLSQVPSGFRLHHNTVVDEARGKSGLTHQDAIPLADAR